MLMSMLPCFFFFQAEDGIRDLVRSRGLGDVYKRQLADRIAHAVDLGLVEDDGRRHDLLGLEVLLDPGAVSYTHLTLPTSDLV